MSRDEELKHWNHIRGEPFLREDKDMPPTPEPQNVSRCAELREGCRDAIFSEMQRLDKEQSEVRAAEHQAVMQELGEIKTKMAYQDGLSNGKSTAEHKPVVRRRRLLTWEELIKFAVIVGVAAATAVGAAIASRPNQPEKKPIVGPVAPKPSP